jgi:hypothetical protein
MDIQIIKTYIDMFSALVQIIGVLVGAYILCFVFIGFHPNMDLTLNTEWVGESKDLLLVKIEIKNISKVRCGKKKVLIQFLEYPGQIDQFLSEWVPFSEQSILVTEKPIEWSNPVEIFATTRFWYPYDTVKAERLYKCSKQYNYKIGLQLHANISLIGRLSRVFTISRLKKVETWTTTKIIPNAYGRS